MRDVIQDDVASGRSMILQGDLNYEPGTDLYAELSASGIIDAYTDEDPGLTFSSTDRRYRIDLIFAHGPISNRVSSCRVLAEGAFIDHPDDLAGFALSDHIPLLAEFDW